MCRQVSDESRLLSKGRGGQGIFWYGQEMNFEKMIHGMPGIFASKKMQLSRI
jgi:hypothetical protein